MFILAGGGFLGSFIVIAVFSIIFFVARLIIGAISKSVNEAKYGTGNLSSVSDINQLNNMLNYLASEEAHDPEKINQVCQRILSLKPEDVNAKWWSLVSIPKYRSYNESEANLFESLYVYYQDNPSTKKEEEYLIFLYLYSYYFSEDGQDKRSQELLNELKSLEPNYQAELKFFVDNWPLKEGGLE